MPKRIRDVHTEHCCKEHGCKYGDRKCTVTTGKLPQSYPCETCVEDAPRMAAVAAVPELRSTCQALGAVGAAMNRSKPGSGAHTRYAKGLAKLKTKADELTKTILFALR